VKGLKMNSYYEDWAEDALRNAIWQLANNTPTLKQFGKNSGAEAYRTGGITTHEI